MILSVLLSFPPSLVLSSARNPRSPPKYPLLLFPPKTLISSHDQHILSPLSLSLSLLTFTHILFPPFSCSFWCTRWNLQLFPFTDLGSDAASTGTAVCVFLCVL